MSDTGHAERGCQQDGEGRRLAHSGTCGYSGAGKKNPSWCSPQGGCCEDRGTEQDGKCSYRRRKKKIFLENIYICRVEGEREACEEGRRKEKRVEAQQCRAGEPREEAGRCRLG